MGYHFTTASGSHYFVDKYPDSIYFRLQGGTLPKPLEIYINDRCFAGEPWSCRVTPNPENGGYANKIIRTSIVKSVGLLAEREEEIDTLDLE